MAASAQGGKSEPGQWIWGTYVDSGVGGLWQSEAETKESSPGAWKEESKKQAEGWSMTDGETQAGSQE